MAFKKNDVWHEFEGSVERVTEKSRAVLGDGEEEAMLVPQIPIRDSGAGQ